MTCGSDWNKKPKSHHDNDHKYADSVRSICKWSSRGQLGKCKFVKVHTHTQRAVIFEKAAAKLSFHNKRTKPVMEV